MITVHFCHHHDHDLSYKPHIQTQKETIGIVLEVLSYQIITHVTAQLDISAVGQNFTLMQMEP